MSVLAIILNAIVAIFFLGMGLLGLIWPNILVSQFGIELRNSNSRGEIRAVYGGYGIAVGTMLLLSVSLEMLSHMQSGIAFAMAISLCGMAGGRLVSFLIEPKLRPWNPFPLWFYFVVEIVLAVMLFLSAYSS